MSFFIPCIFAVNYLLLIAGDIFRHKLMISKNLAVGCPLDHIKSLKLCPSAGAPIIITGSPCNLHNTFENTSRLPPTYTSAPRYMHACSLLPRLWRPILILVRTSSKMACLGWVGVWTNRVKTYVGCMWRGMGERTSRSQGPVIMTISFMKIAFLIYIVVRPQWCIYSQVKIWFMMMWGMWAAGPRTNRLRLHNLLHKAFGAHFGRSFMTPERA